MVDFIYHEALQASCQVIDCIDRIRCNNLPNSPNFQVKNHIMHYVWKKFLRNSRHFICYSKASLDEPFSQKRRKTDRASFESGIVEGVSMFPLSDLPADLFDPSTSGATANSDSLPSKTTTRKSKTKDLQRQQENLNIDFQDIFAVVIELDRRKIHWGPDKVHYKLHESSEQLLDLIVASQSRGAVQAILSKELNIDPRSTFNFVKRLVNLGYIDKKIYSIENAHTFMLQSLPLVMQMPIRFAHGLSDSSRSNHYDENVEMSGQAVSNFPLSSSLSSRRKSKKPSAEDVHVSTVFRMRRKIVQLLKELDHPQKIIRVADLSILIRREYERSFEKPESSVLDSKASLVDDPTVDRFSQQLYASAIATLIRAQVIDKVLIRDEEVDDHPHQSFLVNSQRSLKIQQKSVKMEECLRLRDDYQRKIEALESTPYKKAILPVDELPSIDSQDLQNDNFTIDDIHESELELSKYYYSSGFKVPFKVQIFKFISCFKVRGCITSEIKEAFPLLGKKFIDQTIGDFFSKKTARIKGNTPTYTLRKEMEHFGRKRQFRYFPVTSDGAVSTTMENPSASEAKEKEETLLSLLLEERWVELNRFFVHRIDNLFKAAKRKSLSSKDYSSYSQFTLCAKSCLRMSEKLALEGKLSVVILDQPEELSKIVGASGKKRFLVHKDYTGDEWKEEREAFFRECVENNAAIIKMIHLGKLPIVEVSQPVPWLTGVEERAKLSFSGFTYDEHGKRVFKRIATKQPDDEESNLKDAEHGPESAPSVEPVPLKLQMHSAWLASGFLTCKTFSLSMDKLYSIHSTMSTNRRISLIYSAFSKKSFDILSIQSRIFNFQGRFVDTSESFTMDGGTDNGLFEILEECYYNRFADDLASDSKQSIFEAINLKNELLSSKLFDSDNSGSARALNASEAVLSVMKFHYWLSVSAPDSLIEGEGSSLPVQFVLADKLLAFFKPFCEEDKQKSESRERFFLGTDIQDTDIQQSSEALDCLLHDILISKTKRLEAKVEAPRAGFSHNFSSNLEYPDAKLELFDVLNDIDARIMDGDGNAMALSSSNAFVTDSPFVIPPALIHIYESIILGQIIDRPGVSLFVLTFLSFHMIHPLEVIVALDNLVSKRRKVRRMDVDGTSCFFPILDQ